MIYEYNEFKTKFSPQKKKLRSTKKVVSGTTKVLYY